jgi:hypothetical protein
MERALALLTDQGGGWGSGGLQNNLAIARYPLQGPARSLTALEEAILFCEQRGLVEMAAFNESNLPILMAELGRTDEALERAVKSVVALETSGSAHAGIEPRAVKLAIQLARGDKPERAEAERLVETARAVGAVDAMPPALAAAAAAQADRGSACALLAELEGSAGANATPYYARGLPGMARTALAAGDSALATRLVERLELHYPLHAHALCAVRAQLAEYAGNHAGAAALYVDAAARWRDFGNVPERAYALLGQGRCLAALDEPVAAEPLREARELFASMGYRPALSETEVLLGEGEAAAV